MPRPTSIQPLCYAADAGSRGVVSVLLGVGSDPCVVSHMGDTPAMLAYAKEYESLGELLEEAAGKGKGASIGGDIACQGKELTKARLDERLEGVCKECGRSVRCWGGRRVSGGADM